MKVVIFDATQEDIRFFPKALDGSECMCVRESLSHDTISLAVDADVVSVFVTSEIRKDILDKMLQLKMIATRSTGFDHIDVGYAKQKGISVCNVPAYGSRTVAEYTFALILTLARKVIQANRAYRENAVDLSQACYEGFELFGKTIGIVGIGRIGGNVARIARGFGMRILAPNICIDESLANETGLTYVPMDTLLTESDIITLHVPLNNCTEHMIGAHAISKMKKTAIIVNTARGEVIDTTALLKAVARGDIAGAGLDVLEGERYMRSETELLTNGRKDAMETKDGFRILLESNALVHNHNVLATPHMAYCTKEAIHEIRRISADNISAFASGVPINLVNLI